MNMTRKKESNESAEYKQVTALRAYSRYTVIFLLISVVAFSQFIIFQKTMVWKDDGFLQWYALLAKLKAVVTDFIQGNGIALWSWDTGLGADWIGNYAIIFCDPFNYLAVFFSKEKLDVAYSVIIVLKLYCAGAVMLAFLRYHNKRGIFCLIGAIGYAFCAWGILSIRHDFFITQIILFPLIILGVDKVDDKKSPLTLIMGVFLSVITSLYFSYMTAIFVCIYIVVKYFVSKKEKTAKDFLIRLLRFVVYAVTGGVLLAAPILVPVLYTLMQASTGSGVDIQTLPTLKQLLRFIPAFAGNIDIGANDSIVGMNMLFVAMIPAMILLCKKRKISIWMFLITLVFVLLPFLQSVMNGFSYSSGRWCYVLSFFFAYAAVECLESKVVYTKQFRNWLAIWFAVIFGVSLVALVCFKAISTIDLVSILINMLFGVAGYFIIVMKDLEYQKKMTYLASVVFVNVALLLVILYSPYVVNKIDVYMTQGKCYEIYNSSSLKEGKNIDDHEFYRVDSVDSPVGSGENAPYTHTPANINIYWNVPSLFEYLSTLDSKWLDFNKYLGNNSGYYRRMCAYSNDNRSRMDYLLGVKYFLGDKKDYELSQYAGYGYEEIENTNDVSILQSKYDISLGYVYKSAIAESDWMTYSPLEREQVLMQSAEVSDEDMKQLKLTSSVSNDDLLVDTKQVIYTLYGSEGAAVSDRQINVDQENATITVSLAEEVKDSEIYLVFRNLKKKSYTVDELWDLEVENTGVSDSIAKTKFYSDYLSYTPYGDFAIMASADNVNKRLVNAEGEPQAVRDIEDYTVNMGYKKKFSGEITCTFSDLGQYTYDSIDVIAVPQKDFDSQAKQLEKNRLNVSEYDGNHVAGSIDTKEGGLLYLSILYNEGWNIFVDGKKVDSDKIYQVNTAFTGIEVTSGYHDIELKYQPVGYPMTIVLFGIGVIVTLLIVVFYKKLYRREDK